MIPQIQKLDVLVGQALSITIPVVDDAGQAVDIEGAVITFEIASSTGGPVQDTLPTTVLTNEITAELSSQKTIELGLGRHFFICWTTTNNDSTPVARGYINILRSNRG